MRIIAEGTLKKYYQYHPETETGLKIWLQKVRKASWRQPADITEDFNHARPNGNGRVVFNINKNDYRLIVQINYDLGQVFICFIGTHSKYDSIDPMTIWDY